MVNNVNQEDNFECDTLIINALVFVGDGNEGIKQDVAIKGEKIVAIGELKYYHAEKIINAEGLVLAPGFIDVHTHDDLELIRNPKMYNKISQGVTSVIVGNCGISASPYYSSTSPVDPINLLGTAEEFNFPSLKQYIEKINKVKPSINVAALVGHTSLRVQVMDRLDRAATPSEISKMSVLLNEALQQGAKGLSSGLAYKNATAAPSAEIAALVTQIKAFDGVYCTHLRTEFDGIITALDEAFTVAKNADVPVVISHLKCAGKANWGRAHEVINHIKKNQQQQKISCDCYPYNASSSTLDLKQVTDDFEIDITWSEPHPEKAQQNLTDIAKQWQIPILAAAKRLQPAGAVYHGINEQDVQTIIKFDSAMIGSDGLPCDPHPHPRLWGAFPRVLGHYCRDLNIIHLAEAIHKMTGLSATEFSLKNRGFIQVGFYADLVLFDANTIKDMANFSDPIKASRGINKVWVNGQLSFQASNENYLNELSIPDKGAGRFLSHTPNEEHLIPNG